MTTTATTQETTQLTNAAKQESHEDTMLNVLDLNDLDLVGGGTGIWQW